MWIIYSLAKKRAKKEFGFAEVAGSKEQPMVQRRLKEILDPFVRTVESKIKNITRKLEKRNLKLGKAIRQHFRVLIKKGKGLGLLKLC